MPSKPIRKLTAWSYSRYYTYSVCPRKAKLGYIDKIREPANAAMDRGSKIHILAEKYVTSPDRVKIPEELKYFSEEFMRLRRRRKKSPDSVLTEKQWAFTENWEPTGWFDRDAWCRVVLDVIIYNEKTHTATVVDYKTGKIRDNHKEQLSLYALAMFTMFGDCKTVDASMWYLDQGEIGDTRYTRDQLEWLREEWEKKSKPMLNDTVFAPTPSWLCKWCFYSKDKNGPCEF